MRLFLLAGDLELQTKKKKENKEKKTIGQTKSEERKADKTTYLGDRAALGSTANSRTRLLVFFVAFFVAFFNMDVFGFFVILELKEDERPPVKHSNQQ